MKRLLTLLTLTACGCPEYGQPSEIVVNSLDSKLQDAVQEFYTLSAACGIEAHPTVVSIEDVGPGRIGECEHRSRHVRLHPSVLQDTRSRYFLKYIVFHELAHCAHGADHTEDVDSLMHPRIWPTSLADQERRIGVYISSLNVSCFEETLSSRVK